MIFPPYVASTPVAFATSMELPPPSAMILGVVKKVQDIVEADGLKCTTYLGVVPNPTVDVVNESTKCYKESGAPISSIAFSAIASVNGDAKLDTYASNAWISASTPQEAAIDAGAVIISCGSRTAYFGNIS